MKRGNQINVLINLCEERFLIISIMIFSNVKFAYLLWRRPLS